MSITYTKCLDNKSGKYYYINNNTNESTWDKPHDSLVVGNLATNLVIKRKVVDPNRAKLISDFYAFKEEEHIHDTKGNHEDILFDRFNLWQKKMLEASHNNGELSISWIKMKEIHPILYTFETKFHMYLRVVRLIGIELSEIPSTLFNCCKHIEILSLPNNIISTLPDNMIDAGSQLWDLDMNNNQLTALPTRFGLLYSLSHLQLGNNKIDKLPMTYGALKLITRLDLERNNLISLPETLDHLLLCEYINVNSNIIVKLPQCIGRMKRLKTLCASNNKISFIPDELCTNTTLEILRLNNNLIRYLPEKFGNMKSLIELSLDHNKLQKLPTSFYKLTSLKILRIDPNLDMKDPTPEIRMQGAVAVVAHSLQSFHDMQLRLMKAIIYATQDLLYQVQVQEKHIADVAYFEPTVYLDGDQDGWYAVNWKYLWNTLIPQMKTIWKYETDNYEELHRNNHITTYPYKENEVNWAFDTYVDAYGSLRRNEMIMFKKCACIDNKGVRQPCIPPQKGYMCKRLAVCIKQKIIRQVDKKERVWLAYKKKSIEDAIKRAQHEAVMYLDSKPGRKWLEEEAMERTENVMAEKGSEGVDDWKIKLSTQRKMNIIEKYKNRIETIDKEYYTQLEEIDTQLDTLQYEESLADEKSYQKISINAQITKLSFQRMTLSHPYQIEELQRQCEEECLEVDQKLFISESDDDDDDDDDDNNGGVSRSGGGGVKKIGSGDNGSENGDNVSDSDETLSEPSVEENTNDPLSVLQWTKYRKHLVKKAIHIQKEKDMKVNQDLIRKTKNSSTKSDGGGGGTTPRRLSLAEKQRKKDKQKQLKKLKKQKKKKKHQHIKKKKNTLSSLFQVHEELSDSSDDSDEEFPNILEIASDSLQHAYETAKRIKQKTGANIKYINKIRKKNTRHVADIAEFRIRKLYIESTGKFQDIKIEMIAELSRQYEQNQIILAKQKAERDLKSVETFRHHWGEVELETVFAEWKKYFYSRKERQLKDLHEEWLIAKQKFETAMQSVFLAQHSVDKWEKCQDIYSDVYFWRHIETGQVTLDEPGIHNYLPPDFIIPEMPQHVLNLDTNNMTTSTNSTNIILDSTMAATNTTNATNDLETNAAVISNSSINNANNTNNIDYYNEGDKVILSTPSLPPDNTSINSSDIVINSTKIKYALTKESSKSTSHTLMTEADMITSDGDNNSHNTTSLNTALNAQNLPPIHQMNIVSYDPSHVNPIYPPTQQISWDALHGITVKSSSSSSSSTTTYKPLIQQYTYGPDSLRGGGGGDSLNSMNRAVFQEEMPKRILPQIYQNLSQKVDNAKLYLQRNTDLHEVMKLPRVQPSNINQVDHEVQKKADREAQRIRRELRKKVESSHAIRMETYRKQKDIIPHSLQDTIKLKEIQRLQALQKPVQITEDEYIEHHITKQSFWERHMKPMFTYHEIESGEYTEAELRKEQQEQAEYEELKAKRIVKKKAKDSEVLYQAATRVTATLKSPFKSNTITDT